jgi:predicted dehydrogenase
MTSRVEKIWQGGMIGAGAWSETQLRAWAGVDNARIVALCEQHRDRRDRAVARFAIPAGFEDVETMLDEAEIDFVDICTRPSSHAMLIAAAVRRGLPILCQKPFCTSLAEARETVALCHSAGVPLMINENFRWQGWYRKAKMLLDEGALGRPFLAGIHRRLRITLPHFNHPQAYLKEMPRLILYEVGVHYLDTFRFLFGEPDRVYARLHKVSAEVAGEDVQVIILGYPAMTGMICNSWASIPVPDLDMPQAERDGAVPRLEIDGAKATLTLDCNGSMRLVSDREEAWKFPADTLACSHIAAHRHFIDCLESGTEFETSGAETIRTMSLVYACYVSAKEGRAVDPRQLV